MSDIAISIENVRKQYRLGAIGGTTLAAEIESWWAAKRKKEDPNLKIGVNADELGTAFWALDGINLNIYKGEAVGVIGTNGAGKSTLLKILSRVTAPTEGRIGINGRVTSMLEVGTGFHPELTGRENIYMNGAILGMTKKEIDAKMEDIIEFSECRQFIDTPVKRYSSGMYVKLGFAVASHLESEIMIMDEVLAVGDVKFQQKCLGKMGNVSHNDGKTVLYVSHNMSTIKQLCDRCVVLSHGKVVYDGDTDKAIQVYIGEEENNLISMYDVSKSERPSLKPGIKVRLESLEFIDKEAPVYSNDEPIQMRIRWKSFDNVGPLYFYLIVKYVDMTTIGMVESTCIGMAEKDKEDEAIITMDISNLADGLYFSLAYICTINEVGQTQDYDHPVDRFYFKVLTHNGRKGIAWQRNRFGSISLGCMDIEKI